MLEFLLEQDMEDEELNHVIADAADEEIVIDEDDLKDAAEPLRGTDIYDDHPELDFIEDEYDDEDLEDIDIDEEVPVDDDEYEDDEEINCIADELDAIDAEIDML